MVTTTAFAELTNAVAVSLGLPDARIAVVEHPLAQARPEACVDSVIALFTR